MNSQERAVDHTRCWCHQPLAGLPPAVPVSPGGTAPAETIRRAVTLIRERAAGCQPRRWHWEALGDKRYPQPPGGLKIDFHVLPSPPCYELETRAFLGAPEVQCYFNATLVGQQVFLITR